MVVVQSFPVLNLPLLPLKEVISHMRLVDQIWFSMVSRKTKDLVKQNTICHLQLLDTVSNWSSSYKIECKNKIGSESFKIDIFGINRRPHDCLYQRIYGTDVPIKLMEDSLTTFWEDRLEGFWKITSVLCSTFKINNFFINVSVTNMEKLQKITEHFQKLKSEFNVNVSKIEIAGMSSDGDIYKYVLENFNDIPEVFVHCHNTIYYHSNVEPDKSYCEIKNATSLTLRDMNLLKKYKTIKVYRLTIQEINQFLKEWMESTIMKNVELTTNDVNIDMVIKGLPVTLQRKFIRCGKVNHLNAKCYEVQRNDGVKAHFWDNFGSFAMQTYQ